MLAETERPLAAPPNYAARRMLATAVVITTIAAAGLLGWRVLGGGSDEDVTVDANWNQIALIDRAAGTVSIVDAAGASIGATGPFGAIRTAEHSSTHLALAGFNQLHVVDVQQLAVAPWTLELEPRTAIIRVPRTDRLLLASVRDTGGNIMLIDTATSTTFDVGDLADLESPLFFAGTIRTDANGTRIAVADAGTFQTILVDTETGATTFFPDQPLAVGDGLIATSQVLGGTAEIGLFGDDGIRRTSVPAELPVDGFFDGDRLIYLTVDGEIYAIKTDSKQPELITAPTLPLGAQARSLIPALGGDRIIVAGDTFVTIVDRDGVTVASATFTNAITPLPAERAWRCLAVGGDRTFQSLIDLTSGEPVADLTGLVVTQVSADGCTVLGERLGGAQIVSADGIISLPPGHDATLAPDATAVVWTTPTGVTQLVGIDEDFALTDPIDLTVAVASEIVFVDG